MTVLVKITKSAVIALFIGSATWMLLARHAPLALAIVGGLAGATIVPLIARREEKALGFPLIRGDYGSQEPRAPSAPRERLRRALIVGAGAVGQMLAERLEADSRYCVVGFVDDEIDPLGNKQCPILGPRWATPGIVRQYGIDEVFLAYAPTWQQELTEALAQEDRPVRVRAVPSAYETMLCAGRIESIGDVALLPVTAGAKRADDRVKRFFDLTLAFCGLLLLFPVMALLALLIVITSPGPALFTQERVGRFGKPFTLYKFRTMRQDAEAQSGPVLSTGKSDQRLTSLGRWLRLLRLDELPQLLNVLKGEMSLVGPRPERPHFVKQFVERNPTYAWRHDIRPGITGLAQVHAGYHTDARDKLRFDLFYLAHQSLWLDLSILARTILDAIRRPSGC